MLVQCIGSGDAFGSNGKLNTSFYVRAGGKGMLLDCGATTLVGLKKAGLSSADIDFIIISHLHGDHIGGIPFLITERQVKGDEKQPLTIIGPAGTERKATIIQTIFFPGIADNIRFPLSFTEYESEKELAFGANNTLVAFPARHGKETNPHSIRLRVDSGTVAYSGDTEWYDGLIDVCEKADLFICEAYGFNEPERHHMDVKKLISMTPTLHVGKIVLTHMSAEAYASRGQIPLEVAEDGKVIFDG